MRMRMAKSRLVSKEANMMRERERERERGKWRRMVSILLLFFQTAFVSGWSNGFHRCKVFRDSWTLCLYAFDVGPDLFNLVRGEKRESWGVSFSLRNVKEGQYYFHPLKYIPEEPLFLSLSLSLFLSLSLYLVIFGTGESHCIFQVTSSFHLCFHHHHNLCAYLII